MKSIPCAVKRTMAFGIAVMRGRAQTMTALNVRFSHDHIMESGHKQDQKKSESRKQTELRVSHAENLTVFLTFLDLSSVSLLLATYLPTSIEFMIRNRAFSGKEIQGFWYIT